MSKKFDHGSAYTKDKWANKKSNPSPRSYSSKKQRKPHTMAKNFEEHTDVLETVEGTEVRLVAEQYRNTVEGISGVSSSSEVDILSVDVYYSGSEAIDPDTTKEPIRDNDRIFHYRTNIQVVLPKRLPLTDSQLTAVVGVLWAGMVETGSLRQAIDTVYGTDSLLGVGTHDIAAYLSGIYRNTELESQRDDVRTCIERVSEAISAADNSN